MQIPENTVKNIKMANLIDTILHQLILVVKYLNLFHFH